jgi:ketosteroid isomerase-like protein
MHPNQEDAAGTAMPMVEESDRRVGRVRAPSSLSRRVIDMIRIGSARVQNFVGAALLGLSFSALWACSAQSEPARGQQAGAHLPQAAGMSAPDTAEVMRRFNKAFVDHDPGAFPDLIARDCVMETMQPAPDGARYEGYEANLAFWQALAADRSTRFQNEEMTAIGDRAVIRWRIHFGQSQSLRGVTLLRVRDGRIVEALAYSKVPGEPAPLPARR